MSAAFVPAWPALQARIHTDRNTVLQSVVADLPGYTAGVERLTHLATALDKLRTGPLAPQSSRNTLFERVLSSSAAGPLDVAALVKHAKETGQSIRAATETQTAVIEAGRAVVSELDTIVDASADRLLIGLNTRLQELLTEAAAGVFAGSAEDAIEADRVHDYQQSLTWGQEYRTIRAAQRTVMTALAHLERVTENLLPGLTMSNVLEVFPDYGPWAAGVAGRDERGNAYIVAAPFPPLGWEADQRAQLAWLVKHPEAGVWVPTVPEHEATQETLAKARSAAHNGDQDIRHGRSVDPRQFSRKPPKRVTV